MLGYTIIKPIQEAYIMNEPNIITSKESKTAITALTKLGLTANYTGFYPAAYAITLSLHDPTVLQCVSKLIYPDVARAFHTDVKCVERNIRTLTKRAWKTNAALLSDIAGYTLSKAPSNSEMLAIITTYILQAY